MTLLGPPPGIASVPATHKFNPDYNHVDHAHRHPCRDCRAWDWDIRPQHPGHVREPAERILWTDLGDDDLPREAGPA